MQPPCSTSVQAILDGLLFGATYSLIGIGFTLVFGVMHKINMAYAAASIGGAYCRPARALAAGPAPRRPGLVFLGCVASPAACSATSSISTCFRFIPLASPLATLMSTVGMLLLIDEIIVHLTAGMPQNYPALFDDVMLSSWASSRCAATCCSSSLVERGLHGGAARPALPHAARPRDARGLAAAGGGAALRHPRRRRSTR